MAKQKSYTLRVKASEGMLLNDFKRSFTSDFSHARGKAGAEIVKASPDRKCKDDNVLAVEIRGPLSLKQDVLVTNHRYGAHTPCA